MNAQNFPDQSSDQSTAWGSSFVVAKYARRKVQNMLRNDFNVLSYYHSIYF